MTFSVFINFDGNCRKAVEFYAKAFQKDMPELMTYGDTPGYTPDEKDKDRIMYTALEIGGVTVMFMDFSSDMEMKRGNNVQPSLGIEDKAEVERLFNALKEGGTVGMEPQKTFWSDLYAMVTDQFGVDWHLSYYDMEKMY